MKKSKLARARTAMHNARHSENQVRDNYRQLKQHVGELKVQRNLLRDVLKEAIEVIKKIKPAEFGNGTIVRGEEAIARTEGA